MAMAYMTSGYFFPKSSMVILVLPIEPFSKCDFCNFALRLLNAFEFATVFCKFKWYHALYGFGVENCRDCNGDVHVMFCATQVDMVLNT